MRQTTDIPRAIPVPADASPRLSLRALSLFTLQLETMLAAGFSYARSLKALMQSEDLSCAQVASSLFSYIQAGLPVATALSRIPQVFSPSYILVVRMGEKTGRVQPALRRLSQVLQQQEDRQGRIKSALMYPAFILAACLGMVAFLVYYMLPGYAVVFSQSGMALPLPTRALLAIAREPLVPLGLVLCVAGFGSAVTWVPRWKAGRRLLERIKYESVLGTFFRLSVMASVLRNLSLLLDGGVSIVESLEALRQESTGWQRMDEALALAQQRIKGGTSFAGALELDPLFPPLVTGSAAAGERAGRLPDMLGRVAAMLDSQVEYRLDQLSRLLEPCILLVMGIVVGFIVLAAFLPVFSLVQGL